MSVGGRQVPVDRLGSGSRWVGRTEVLLLIVAGLGLVAFGLAGLGLSHYLPRVDPSQQGRSTSEHQDIDGAWLLTVLVWSLVIFAAAGLPRRRGSGTECAPSGGPSWWTVRGSLRGATVQGIGGFVAAVGTFAVHRVTFYFSGPGDGCVYASCWPLYEQQAALFAPGVSAGLAMVAMALLVRRVRWWVRAFAPVLVWLVTLTVQYLTWTPYLLPLFEGPPR